MRPVLIAAAMLSVASAADAQQRIITRGPEGQPGAAPSMGDRQWGERSGGYWAGGVRAPGGYRAYHRPVRGFVLPGYWIAPTFLIGDWSRYGLQRPPVGYRWSRYYDDAVLVDDRGTVFDSVEGVDWDHSGGPDQAYAGGPGAGYPPPPGGYAPRGGDYRHHDSGAGGALAGAAVGGAVGAIAGGRHERLGGALIGAGAGALAGYAIDRGEDRRRERMAPPPYGAGYPPPPPGGYGMGRFPPPPYPSGPGYPHTIVTPGGTTVTTTTSSGGYGGDYYNPGATTVTVQNAPVVTTTTVETIEDSVTYTRPVSRRVYVKRRWHRASKLQCRCGR